jgi:uncharacterized protein (TIGR00251 family)
MLSPRVSSSPAWFKVSGLHLEIQIFAKPNANKSAITGISENGLCIALRARPQEGEANIELIQFLAKYLHLPKSQISLRRGEAARHKAVQIPHNQALHDQLVQIDHDFTAS